MDTAGMKQQASRTLVRLGVLLVLLGLRGTDRG